MPNTIMELLQFAINISSAPVAWLELSCCYNEDIKWEIVGNLDQARLERAGGLRLRGGVKGG